MNPELPPRVLIVDDNPSIHEDFRKILGGKTESVSQLEKVEASLFGSASETHSHGGFRIDSATQGREALAMVEKSLREDDPYALAFVDVRMPPGWDGIETLERLWQCAPDLQAVICTAYSDYSWDEMIDRLGHTDNLLILKKPFDTIEVLQITHALTQKWHLTRQVKTRLYDLDVAVRKRTAELRATEERFSKAFDSSPIPKAIIRCSDQKFFDVNQSFLTLVGKTQVEVLNSSSAEFPLWSAGPKPQIISFCESTRLRGQSCVLHRGNGASRQVMLSTEPLVLSEAPYLLLIIEDVTEHLKIEAQLRQAQKMEVIGRMAAGVAHEFNNILTVIQGDVGLLQQTSTQNPADRGALLDQIMQASQRAATFTRQLLAFSRKQVLQPHVLDFSEVVLRTRKMLMRLVGEKIELEMRCIDRLPVLADEGGIEQVLMNLVLNARDATSGDGRIEISTGQTIFEPAKVAENPEARPGRFARLTVTDQGCGMSAQVLARIFDPFFTTKAVGKGTGLGLSTIHGIVKQHDGWIEVTSEIGKGSTFNIYFPICDLMPSTKTVIEENHSSAPGKGETILVVEDETSVRDLVSMALQKRGYRVLKADNGPQAVDVWNHSAVPVDLLLTDMVMPSGMTGGELAQILQTRHPNLKIIYTSGYSPEILSQDSLLTQGINFLPKPYDLPALLHAVRLCLDGGRLPQYEIRPSAAPATTTA